MADLRIEIDTSGVKSGERVIKRSFDNISKGTIKLDANIKRLGKALNNNTVALKKYSRGSKEAAKSTNILNIATGNLIADGVGELIGLLVKSIPLIVSYSDAWLKASNSIKVFLDESQDVETIRKNLVNLSLETRTDLSAQITLYNRLNLVQKELGATQSQIINVIEGVGKAIGVTSTTALEARGSLIQLSQAFGQSIVRAEEINSILEGTPRIAKAVADGLGVTTSRLRELIKEGLVSSKTFFIGLQSQTDELREEFDKVEVTISQGVTNLRTGATTFIGTLLQISGIQPIVAGSLTELGKALANFAGTLPGINDNLKIFVDQRLKEITFALNSFTKVNDVVIERLEKRFRSLGDKKIFETEVAVDTTDFIRIIEDRLTSLRKAEDRALRNIRIRPRGGKQAALETLTEVRTEQANLNFLLERERQVQKQILKFKDEQAKRDAQSLEEAQERIRIADEELRKRDVDKKAQKERLKREKELAPIKRQLLENIEQGTKAQTALNRIERSSLIITKEKQELIDRLNTSISIGAASEKRFFEVFNKESGKSKDIVDDIIEAFRRLDVEQKRVLKTEQKIESTLDTFFGPIERIEEGIDSSNTPFQKYIDGVNESIRVTTLLENATVAAFKGMEDALTNFILTGQTGWRDLANTAIAEITRIFVRSQIIAPLANIASGFSFSSVGSFLGFANGGVASGSISSASNSIISSPTIFPNSSPITGFANGGVAVGEGTRSEAVLPLTRVGGDLGVKTDGAAPTVNVIVENNMGQQAEVSTTEPVFNDRGELVLGIVINALNTNQAGFRDNIRQVANQR